jgi:hypothetical protein
MSDPSMEPLAGRIGAMIARIKVLAAERDAFHAEGRDLQARIDRAAREHDRLRGVLSEAARELRQE